jgi:hypothetical protein
LFLANFSKDYESELNFTTNVMEFFQQKSIFSEANTKGLKELNIDQLTFKLNTIPMDKEDSGFWNLLNAQYVSPLIYKVSMLVIQDEEHLISTKLVKKVDINSNLKEIKN